MQRIITSSTNTSPERCAGPEGKMTTITQSAFNPSATDDVFVLNKDTEILKVCFYYCSVTALLSK